MPVRVLRQGGSAVCTLDRPDKRNAMDPEMTASLDRALNDLDDDSEVRAVVLAAAGTTFCAGTDLRLGSGEPTDRGGYYGITRRVRTTPIIAAVEGAAFGGGFEIVLSCDVVIASRSATFGLPEVSRGVVATTGGLFRAPRALPPMIAAELLLTGDPLDAARAAALGLVNRVVDDGQALTVALEIAERISRNSPAAVRATLTAMHAITGRDDLLGWQATAAARATVLASPDAAEGKNAFLQRRAPRWSRDQEVRDTTRPPSEER